MLERPEIPLHNNLSENDIRQYVKKRKISAGKRSNLGPRWRDTFLSRKSTGRKMGITSWQYLQDRIRGTNLIPNLADLIRAAAAERISRKPQHHAQKRAASPFLALWKKVPGKLRSRLRAHLGQAVCVHSLPELPCTKIGKSRAYIFPKNTAHNNFRTRTRLSIAGGPAAASPTGRADQRAITLPSGQPVKVMITLE